MKFQIEGKSEVANPSENLLRKMILSLRSYGPSSYASLSDANGNYVQIAGGGQTCMIERRNAETGKHYRGFKNEKSKIFSDGTILSFSGGEVKLKSDEWFSNSEAIEVFVSFLNSEDFPNFVKWRNISEIFT